MPETATPEPVRIGPQDDPLIEVGQLADERQFLAALLRLDEGWMAVVHFFAAEGEHLESEHSDLYPGNGKPTEQARGAFERLLRRLEPYRQDVVTICGVRIELSGHAFGVVPDPDGGGLRLEPNGPVLPPAGGESA